MMPPIHRLGLLLAAAFFTGECIAAKPKAEEFIQSPRLKMTVYQARIAVREALADAVLPATDVKIDRHELSWVNHPRAGDTATHTFAFSKIRLSAETQRKYFHDPATAERWIDALLTLRAAEFAPDTEATDFAAFASSAKLWQAMSPPPEMPDEARAYRAMAEDAFKRKDFATALDAYCEALDKYPMWPEGHYNAALLAAEVKDYKLAAQHIHRYLVLAPDAPDASTAKDKLLLWQLKSKQKE